MFIRFCKILYQKEKKKIRAIRSKYEEMQVDTWKFGNAKLKKLLLLHPFAQFAVMQSDTNAF